MPYCCTGPGRRRRVDLLRLDPEQVAARMGLDRLRVVAQLGPWRGRPRQRRQHLLESLVGVLGINRGARSGGQARGAVARGRPPAACRSGRWPWCRAS